MIGFMYVFVRKNISRKILPLTSRLSHATRKFLAMAGAEDGEVTNVPAPGTPKGSLGPLECSCERSWQLGDGCPKQMSQLIAIDYLFYAGALHFRCNAKSCAFV